jgi:hypothetical protein
MFNPSCVRGDFVIEIRSLLETPRSIRSSYWVREVGENDRFCGGPFETFPDASRFALERARGTGGRVWRDSAVFLEDGTRSTLQLVRPTSGSALAAPPPVARDCA